MLLVLNGSYVYAELAASARKQQRKVFETKQHLGCVQPVNNYVLTFDTIIRIQLLWQQLLQLIKKQYNITNVVIIKNKLQRIYEQRYVSFEKKCLNKLEFQHAVQKIIDEFSSCGNRYPYKMKEIFDTVAEYYGTYTDSQWGKCTIEESGMKAETAITFDGDKATKVVMTMDLGNKDYAKQYAEIFGGQDGVKAKADGTKVVITYTGDAVADETPTGSKAEVKKALEEEGFKCN